MPYSEFPSDLLDYENAPGTQIWCQMPKAVSVPGREEKKEAEKVRDMRTTRVFYRPALIGSLRDSQAKLLRLPSEPLSC